MLFFSFGWLWLNLVVVAVGGLWMFVVAMVGCSILWLFVMVVEMGLWWWFVWLFIYLLLLNRCYGRMVMIMVVVGCGGG